MNHILSNSTAIAFAFFVSTAVASAETLIEVGIHTGGDELIIENYSNGAKTSADAGGLFSFAMGGTKSFSDRIDGQFSIGIKSDIINTTDPEVTWVRYPINTTIFYRRDKYRIGLGLTAHLSPSLKGNGVAGNISENFKHALGALLEVNFKIDNYFLWGFRYTNITYNSNRRNRSVSGDSLGVMVIALI